MIAAVISWVLLSKLWPIQLFHPIEFHEKWTFFRFQCATWSRNLKQSITSFIDLRIKVANHRLHCSHHPLTQALLSWRYIHGILLVLLFPIFFCQHAVITMCLLSYVAYFKINLINGFTHSFFATAVRVTVR